MQTSEKAATPGALVAIGGAEDKTSRADILRMIISLASIKSPVVGVITTASSIPDEVFEGYRNVFSEIGAAEVIDVRMRDRADAETPEVVDMIHRSDIIFISGGDQMRLTSVLGGSSALQAIRQRRSDGAVVAGTSAGAACQATTMIYGGPADDSLKKGAVRMSAGFGFVEGIIIDTHFLQRGRFSRLMEVGATNPEYLGIGLGEDAAVLFKGDTIRVFGPGHVILVDSTQITGSNVFDLAEGAAVGVHNVIMHALVDGDEYYLKNRQVLAPDALRAGSSGA